MWEEASCLRVGAVQVGGWWWVKWGRHLIANLPHVLRVPTDHSHCIHTRMAYSCPQSTQVTTFAYFAAQAETHERACRHVWPCQPRLLSAPSPQPLCIHSVMQNVAYQLTQAIESEREGLEKCVFTKFPSFVCDL